MTGSVMVDEVCGAVGYDSATAKQIARAVRWLNLSQKDMQKYDWPELIQRSGSFSTSGVGTYDLTSEIDSGFLRVLDKTIRTGTRYLESRSKESLIAIDPNAQRSGQPIFYAMVSKTDMRLDSLTTGDAITLDWIKSATTLTNDTTEANVSFQDDRHDLIVSGAIWRGKRYEQMSAWYDFKRNYELELKDTFIKAVPIRYKTDRIRPILF